MVAKGRKEACALCGEEIQGRPVVRIFDGEEKHFDSEGCAKAYEVARENRVLDQALSDPEKSRSALKELVTLDRGKTAYFSVDGMWCAGCASAAQRMLRHQAGILDADVSFAAEKGRIQYDPSKASPETVLKSLERLGYKARLLSNPSEERASRKEETALLRLIASVAFGMQVMFFYFEQLYPLYASGQFNSPQVRNMQYLALVLATPVFLVGGSAFFQGALSGLRARTANMDTLVALGISAAYFYSVYIAVRGNGEVYFDSVVMITTFVLLGRYLETIGGERARKDIHKLLRLQPDKAWLGVGNSWEEVEAGALVPGDRVLVKPGGRVPADARILEGEAALNESLLTGESLPVNKKPGDTVYAGTVVTDAALVAEVTNRPSETRLAQIARLVEETLSSKPPIQRVADTASSYFTFGILGMAIVTGLAWRFAAHAPAEAILAAVAVLVVACPCALGLATPLALAVTLGRATDAGILVRNAAALETASQVTRVVFDKTGTLTRGQMKVVATQAAPESDLTEDDLLCLAAAVEQFSEHPLARAVVEACKAPLPPARDSAVQRGLGASASVGEDNARRVLVGSKQFLGVSDDMPLFAEAHAHAERGETVVWVGWDGKAVGFIAIRDEPNPTAKEALAELQAKGIRTVMLSGDNPATAKAIAEELGIAEYEGNTPPDAKASRIKEWQAQGERVAMIGDGVNDAPALAQANLSITAAGGTDVAGETSDVILTSTDLRAVPKLILRSTRTRRIIFENLGWAFAYNMVSVPLAAFGKISPIIAAGAMATSSLLVVGNSLRLRR